MAEPVEERVIELIRAKGPQTGSEVLDALSVQGLVLWRACKLSERLEVRVVGTRYLRLDQRVDGFARLSPSILREFLTYSVVGLAGDENVLEPSAQRLLRHIREVSRSKLALAEEIVGRIWNDFAPSWPEEQRICFILAGDIVYGMAHDVPRPEHSTGKMVQGSDMDLIVVADDGAPGDLLQELDRTIYHEKYRTLITPGLREEIDYVVKGLERVREQLSFDSFKKMVAVKILQEGVLLSGSETLFEEIKAMLVRSGATEKLGQMEAAAKADRQHAEEYLLRADPAHLAKEDLHLFYTGEESEEFGDLWGRLP
ncbi:MAG: hypothetical protein AB1640_06590 [bacterium]